MTTPTHSNQTITLSNLTADDDFEGLPGLTPMPYNLSKAQAVRHLDRAFANYVTSVGLPDLIDKAPDFRTLIDENVRTEFPPSATATGGHRGNRRLYGAIPHLRQSRGKNFALFFRESDLNNWFATCYLPVIAKKLH